jgi:hypothetical protein
MTSRDFAFRRLEELHLFFKLNFRFGYQNYLRRKLGRTAVDALKPSARRAGKFSLRTVDKLERLAAELGFKTLQSSESETNGGTEIRCAACQARLRVIITLPSFDMSLARAACLPALGEQPATSRS